MYEGDFLNNLKHGNGHSKWKDNREYIGEYIKGVKSGIGKYKWNNGDCFIGRWQNGNQNGLGKLISSTSIKYGIWNNGNNKLWLNDNELQEYKSDDTYRKIKDMH